MVGVDVAKSLLNWLERIIRLQAFESCVSRQEWLAELA